MGEDNGTGPKVLNDKASREWPSLHNGMPKKWDGPLGGVRNEGGRGRNVSRIYDYITNKVSHHKSLKLHTPLVAIDLQGGTQSRLSPLTRNTLLHLQLRCSSIALIVGW